MPAAEALGSRGFCESRGSEYPEFSGRYPKRYTKRYTRRGIPAPNVLMAYLSAVLQCGRLFVV
jgi:hypothetical protein